MLALGGLVATGCGGSTETVTVTETRTTTETVTAPAASPLPEAVDRTRGGLLAAAKAGDYDALELYVTDRLSYSFGGPFEGGAIAYWKHLEQTTDERPLAQLARVLQLPPTISMGSYVWPWAYSVPANELTAYERRLLGPLADSYAGESYYGWRAGIAPDGTWIFFVAGD